MRKRILLDFILLSAVFFTPWWVVAIIAFTCAFMCPLFYEIIFFGFLVDLLYGSHTLFLSGAMGTVSAIMILLTATYTRTRMR